MTTEQPFTVAELGERFGILLAQLYAQVIMLEKELEGARNNEVKLTAYLEALKEETKTNLSPEAKAIIDTP